VRACLLDRDRRVAHVHADQKEGEARKMQKQTGKNKTQKQIYLPHQCAASADAAYSELAAAAAGWAPVHARQ
jgi:hypothetical protein